MSIHKKIPQLFSKSGLLLSLVLGMLALTVVVLRINFLLPGTKLSTDPREVFVTISAALTGPIGAIITGFLASFFDSVQELRWYITGQHILSSLLLSLFYYFLTKKLKGIPFFIAWFFLIFLYYFVFYIPLFVISYYFNPEFASTFKDSNSVLDAMLQIFEGWIPEALFTAVYTTMVLMALPRRFRVPQWLHSQITFDDEKKYLVKKRSTINHFVARLFIWFLLVSIISIVTLGIYVRNHVTERILERETNHLVFHANLIKEQVNTNFSNLQSIIERNSPETSILIFDKNGKEITSSADADLTASEILNLNLPARALKNDLKFYLDNTQLKACGIAVSSDKNLVIFCTPRRGEVVSVIEAVVTDTIKNMILFLIIIAIISAAIIYMLVARPIQVFIKAVDRVSEGNYEEAIDERLTDDELFVLAHTFNHMQHNIKSKEIELRQALDRAEESDRLKADLMANMSHELRTPMNAILGYSSILMEELNDENHIQMLKKITSSSTRLLATLTSVMTASRLEAGEIKTYPELFDIVALAERNIRVYELVAREKNLELSYITSSQKIFTQTDITLFNQVFSSLLDNAIKFTMYGSVKISIIESKDTIMIAFADTGIGIPENKLEYIFSDFRQISEGFSRGFEGLGLGLSNAIRLATYLGGTIDVTSSEGKGSVFTFSFPSLGT